MNRPAHKNKGVKRTKTVRFYRNVFTGKERDEETGYGYFGARYMDHELMTMWLSVDPMADKYPSISPYAYCAWNPVRLVDPNGEDIWELNDEGKLVWIKESKYEIIKYGSHSITNKKNCIFGKSKGPKTISLDEGIWKFGADDRNAEMYFEFFADHLDYEFSLFGFENGNKINYELTTWLDPITDENGKLEIKGISDKLRVHVHNHTNGFSNPSTSDNHLGDGNDLDFSESIISSSPNCSFFIYTKDNGGVYSKYNVNGDCGPNIPSRFDKPQYGLQLDKTSGWIRPSPLFDNRYH